MEGGTSGAWTDFQGEQWESASKIMFIAGIEQHQHYGILCCQPWPGGDLLSRGGDQVLIWLYILTPRIRDSSYCYSVTKKPG